MKLDLIKHLLQAVGITAITMVLVAFCLIAMYFSYILGIGLLIISLVVIVCYCIGLLSTSNQKHNDLN